MMRRVILLAGIVPALVLGLHWLASSQRTVTVQWMGYIFETGVLHALALPVMLAAVVLGYWRMTRQVWRKLASLAAQRGPEVKR